MAACASPSGLPASKRPRTHSKGYGASPSTSSLNNGIPVAVSGRKSFARGAIVKLRLENFLTFDRVVIYPQPQLNVIVGPNGTGKSSVVCAICLGLGGSTTLLGRAKDLKDFVKHGKESGFVEVTLYEDRQGGKNPLIRRTLSATSNSSEWTINRRSVMEKEVKKLVESFNIQLDNRCMFLPQDKVVEFARMNKQELLIETERALGPKELYVNHEKLKSLKTEYSGAIESLQKKRKELEDLERQNNLLKRDVERFKKKEEYEEQIKLLSLKKLWVECEDLSHTYYEKKRERQVAVDELRSIKQHYQPIKAQHKKQEDAVVKYQELAQEAVKNVRKAENQVRDHQDKLMSLGDKVDEPRQELENLKKQEAKRMNKVENLRREIEGYKNDLEELESIETLTAKIAEKNATIRQLQKEIGDLGEEHRKLTGELEQLEDVKKQAEQELHQMNNVRVQRLQKLEQRDADTVKAIQWLENNQDKFRQPILEPVCMSLNIVDPRFVKQAEAFFGGRDFLSFVAQNEEDRETFLKAVRDSSMRLRINIVRAPNHTLKDYQPKIPFSTLRGYGFQKMLLDVVGAPDPVLCFFCQYQGLHSVPIAGNLRTDQIDRITSELPDLSNFFTADTRYSVKKSKYRRETSTRTLELFPARFLVASVDNQRKLELEAEIKEKTDSASAVRQSYEELRKKDMKLRQKDSKLRSEKTELRKIVDTHKSHKTNIKTRESKLEQCLAMTFNIPEAEEKCKRDIAKIQGQRVKCLSELKGLVQSAVANIDASVKATLNVSTAKDKVTFFLRQFRQAKSAFDEAEQKVKVLTDEEKDLKLIAKRAIDKAEKETGCKDVKNDNPRLYKTFQQFPDDQAMLDDRIHETRAKAEMCMGTDQSIVDEFNARERRIQEVTTEIATTKSSVDNRDEQIQELKKNWLEPLNHLIDKVNSCFRSYFSQHMGMESAGEVMLDPDPKTEPDCNDFAKYGVQIRVKFRDNEQLQELNAQRQSGGERSVSTMLYLMALQGNTSCPFRVVDEINQGMDPINERRIFNLIVQSAYNGAQYFLLTPKLLQNLEYSEAVAIHLVHNGQEMMECDEWNMDKILSL